MYSVWLEDLAKIIEVFNKKKPTFKTFTSIHGNAYGDFVIKNDADTFIIRHTDWSLWKKENNNDTEQWIEII